MAPPARATAVDTCAVAMIDGAANGDDDDDETSGDDDKVDGDERIDGDDTADKIRSASAKAAERATVAIA